MHHTTMGTVATVGQAKVARLQHRIIVTLEHVDAAPTQNAL